MKDKQKSVHIGLTFRDSPALSRRAAGVCAEAFGLCMVDGENPPLKLKCNRASRTHVEYQLITSRKCNDYFFRP